VGYNFRIASVLTSAFLIFIGTPTSIKEDPTAVSGNGFGDLGANMRFFLPAKKQLRLDNHFGAPSGDRARVQHAMLRGTGQTTSNTVGELHAVHDGGVAIRF